jgi:hypothetical protein
MEKKNIILPFVFAKVIRSCQKTKTSARMLGREAKHSPLSNAEVKNGGAIPQLLYMFSCHSAELSTGKTLPFYVVRRLKHNFTTL